MRLKPKPKKWVKYFRIDGEVYRSVTGQVSRLWGPRNIRNYVTMSLYYTPRPEDGDRLTVLWVRLRTGKK